MHRIPALSVVVAATLYAAPALAACDAAYDTGAMLDDLTVVEDALRAADAPAALAGAERLETLIPCLGEPMPFRIAGRIYRGIAAGKLMGGQDARGREWFLTALEADPTFEYGTEEMPLDSPVRTVYLDLRTEADAEPIEVPDADFTEGRVFLDGALIGSPRATPDRPHLVQQESGSTVNGWVIEGNAFPAEILGAAVAEVPEDGASGPSSAEQRRAARDAARAAAARQNNSGVSVVRAPEKTPLIIGGAVTLAAAGGLYYGSSVTRKQFDDALTEEEAEKARTTTNTLVIASAIALAAGTSALTWGIIVDDGPGITLRGRF